MTLVMRCDEKDRLAGYLYGECSAAERAAVEAHLSRCAACASELDDLKAVRLQLAGWKAPDTDLGFRVTREPADRPRPGRGVFLHGRRPRRRYWCSARAPGWPISKSGYSNQGLTIRTGWGARRARARHAGGSPQLASQARTGGTVTARDSPPLNSACARSWRTARAPARRFPRAP